MHLVPRATWCVSQRHHVEATLIDQRKELLAEHGLEAQDSRLEVLSDCFKLIIKRYKVI